MKSTTLTLNLLALPQFFQPLIVTEVVHKMEQQNIVNFILKSSKQTKKFNISFEGNKNYICYHFREGKTAAPIFVFLSTFMTDLTNKTPKSNN